MSKSTTRILIIIAVACRIVGGLISPPSHTLATLSTSSFVLLGLILLVGWLILLFVGIIGALIKTAQLKQWSWFVALFFILPVFVYIFWGPTDRKIVAQAYKPTSR